MLKDEWLTPPELLKALGPFDLDPCAPVVRPWATAASHLTVEDDGLAKDWPVDSFVWCNPPYGRQAAAWLHKMMRHGSGIALIFARTETAMFFKHVWNAADGVLFLEGRLHFHHVDGTRAAANAGAPSCLVAYGNKALNRLRNNSQLGHLVVLDRLA